MLGIRPKVGIGDAQVVVRAQLEQSLSITVNFTLAELSNTGGPRVVICAHSGIDDALLSTKPTPYSLWSPEPFPCH